jgi:hypothetical protein
MDRELGFIHLPVHEIKIEVVQTKAGQGLINTLLDIGRAMESGPQLSGDEDILALETSFLQTILDTSANSIFVAVLCITRSVSDETPYCTNSIALSRNLQHRQYQYDGSQR